MNKLSVQFVECVPSTLEERTLYVSMLYGTVVHRCCCGCGREVVTPLTPRDWRLIYDGENISLYPSIGSLEFPCRSHYWIRASRVEWAFDIEDAFSAKSEATQEEVESSASPSADVSPVLSKGLPAVTETPSPAIELATSPAPGFWGRLWRRLSG